MFEVIARSESFIYILDRRYMKLMSAHLYHSPSQIANDYAALPKVKNYEEAELVVANMVLEETSDINW